MLFCSTTTTKKRIVASSQIVLYCSWCLFNGFQSKFTPFFGSLNQSPAKSVSEHVNTQGKWTPRGTSHLNKHFLSFGVILTCLSIITGFLQRKSKEKVQALHQSSWKARSNDVPHSPLSKENKNQPLQKVTTVSLCFYTLSVVMADERANPYKCSRAHKHGNHTAWLYKSTSQK